MSSKPQHMLFINDGNFLSITEACYERPKGVCEKSLLLKTNEKKKGPMSLGKLAGDMKK